jgi:hypothetical protein
MMAFSFRRSSINFQRTEKTSPCKPEGRREGGRKGGREGRRVS